MNENHRRVRRRWPAIALLLAVSTCDYTDTGWRPQDWTTRAGTWQTGTAGTHPSQGTVRTVGR